MLEGNMGDGRQTGEGGMGREGAIGWATSGLEVSGCWQEVPEAGMGVGIGLAWERERPGVWEQQGHVRDKQRNKV